MILLDSDVFVDLLRGRSAATEWFNHKRSQKAESFAVPGFALLELIEGTENSLDMQQLRQVMRYFSTLWLSEEGCQTALDAFAAVHLRNAVGFVDTLIAHVALEQALPLHTFNTKHYTAIPGLQTIQPYTR